MSSSCRAVQSARHPAPADAPAFTTPSTRDARAHALHAKAASPACASKTPAAFGFFFRAAFETADTCPTRARAAGMAGD